MSFTCPACGMTSHHPDDARYGYCGACHAFTRQLRVGLRAESRKDRIAELRVLRCQVEQLAHVRSCGPGPGTCMCPVGVVLGLIDARIEVLFDDLRGVIPPGA